MLISLWINGPITFAKISPKIDFIRWVCRMLVELIPCVMDAKMEFKDIPICSLKIISIRIPKVNKITPVTMDNFRYFVASISFLITWDIIKNSPKRPKNIMSFPFEDPIKNCYVTGLMIGLNMSVTKIIPANMMNMNPTKIVLLTFITII